MSHKRRHKAKPKKPPTTKLRTVQGAKAQLYGRREVSRDILIGVLFIVIVLGLKHLIEHTTLGEQMKVMGYNFLQMQLSSESAPVTIVDITDLKPKEFPEFGKGVIATPRGTLKQLIEAIVEQHPKAIGVDIDFSPTDDGFVLPSDPGFFQFCLDLKEKKGVPVFLGVNRTIGKPADEWLGSKRFERLAANILIPNDNKRMLNALQVGDGNSERHTPSRSMSALLADAYNEGETPAIGQWIHKVFIKVKLLQKFSENRIGSGVSVNDFLIDYSSLDSIENEKIETTDPVVLQDSSNRKRLESKIVLIGDATIGQATDTFVVPAHEKPYPGIFLHACAAYTLIKLPLYNLTLLGSIVLDVLLSGIILLGIVLVKYYYKGGEKRDVAAEKWRGGLTLLIVLSAVVVGVVFVRITRIMWDDFFLVLLLLVFHPSIEHHAETFWRKITTDFRSKEPLATESEPL